MDINVLHRLKSRYPRLFKPHRSGNSSDASTAEPCEGFYAQEFDRSKAVVRPNSSKPKVEDHHRSLPKTQTPRRIANFANELHFFNLPPMDLIQYSHYDIETKDIKTNESRRLRANNKQRWRDFINNHGRVKWSNTLLVRWADGTMTLNFDEHIFYVYDLPNDGDQSYLFHKTMPRAPVPDLSTRHVRFQSQLIKPSKLGEITMPVAIDDDYYFAERSIKAINKRKWSKIFRGSKDEVIVLTRDRPIVRPYRFAPLEDGENFEFDFDDDESVKDMNNQQYP